MIKSARGAVVSVLAATLLMGSAVAQEKTSLATDRDKVSYAVGLDVAHAIGPVAQDMDVAAFEQGIRNAFAGGKPAMGKEEAVAIDHALRARVAARTGKVAAGATPGVAPSATPPAVDKVKAGQLIGGLMIGPSLASIKDEIELPVLLQAVRTSLAGGTALLSDTDAKSTLTVFSKHMQDTMQAKAALAGGRNKTEGDAFLARNKAVKGVLVTPSGLQYMVLRAAGGPRPKPGDRVRVNYRGTLLDGTVFDSSYDRGEATEFGLDEVIPGWREGVAMMPVGAKYRFWIPSDLAYGAKGTPGGPVGPNATLVFDVELMSIL
jgi:FKBP-type peptidyl-prolyl cis-trans isomerase FkpA